MDSGNNRIQKFTKDGKFLAKWGQAGSGDGEFNLPWGIDIDSKGDVYVADWRNDRIQKFTPDGQFLTKFGSSGKGEGELDRPIRQGCSRQERNTLSRCDGLAHLHRAGPGRSGLRGR